MWHLRHNIESGWEPREKPGQTCWGHGLEMELILVAEEAASRDGLCAHARRQGTLTQRQGPRGGGAAE